MKKLYPVITEEFRKLRGKEDEEDEWRKYVVEKEYTEILKKSDKYAFRV